MLSLVLSLLLSAGATPDAATSQSSGEATEAPVKEKLICRYVRPSNSRLGKRECRTQKEWNTAADSGASQMGDVRRDQ